MWTKAEMEAASAAASAAERAEARAFVDFVLRHTWPERAKAHGVETVHSIIKHHPFALSHASKQAPSKGTPE